MAALIDDDVLEVFATEATWDGLADALRARYDGLADRLVVYLGARRGIATATPSSASAPWPAPSTRA